MANVKFKDSSISEVYSASLAQKGSLLGPAHVDKVAKVLFTSITKCIAKIKDTTIPKAIVFTDMSGNFVGAAKIEFIKSDDGTSVVGGQWSYTWTVYEEDIEGCQRIDVSSNSEIKGAFGSDAMSLYNMVFSDPETSVIMMTLLIEMIVQYIRENTHDGEDTELELPGVFKAVGTVEDGKVVIAIIPDGSLKVMIKDDSIAEK